MKLNHFKFLLNAAMVTGFYAFELTAAAPKNAADPSQSAGHSQFSAAFDSASQESQKPADKTASASSAQKSAAEGKETAEKEEFVIEARFYRSKSAYQNSSDDDEWNSHILRFHAKPSELATRTVLHLKEYFVNAQAPFPCHRVQTVADLRVVYPRKLNFHEEDVQSDTTLITALQSRIHSAPYMSNHENHLCIIGTSIKAIHN